MGQYGYLGIYVLLVIESVFPPIPSEIILLFGGALTLTAGLNLGQTIIIATAGSLSGAIILYLFGRSCSADRIKTMLSGRAGKVLGLKPEAIDTAVRWFERYQDKAIFFGRCIPMIRSLISIPAGFTAMNIPQFILLTALGSAVWNTLLICTGAALGSAWDSALPYVKRYSLTAVILITILILLYMAFCRIRRKRAD